MKRWQIVYGLPLEVWMDIFPFPWITREEFGQLVDRIGNFKFAEHAQFYLHEWGRRTLTNIYFDERGLYKYVHRGEYNYERINLDVPQTELPENIKSFEHIQMRYFDTRTLNFLGQIRPLLNKLDIEFIGPPDYLDNFGTIWTHLAPLLDAVHSLRCYEFALPSAKQFFGDKFAQLKVLKVSRRPGQFLAASAPRTFAVDMRPYSYGEREFAEFHLENGIGEQLDGKWIVREDRSDQVFQITRHPTNCGAEEMQGWIKAMTEEKRWNRIGLYRPEIGTLDATQVDVQAMDEEQHIQQQPCSSKDA